MTDTRSLILRLRHDSPTRNLSLEAADMIEQLSRAQRRLPAGHTLELVRRRDDGSQSTSFILLPLDEEKLP